MGTGGFIPSNRSQMVTFYNTTGVIEKDKNMYFAPRFEDEDDIVYESFIDKLNAICPPPSDYDAIMLTGWSPEDRTLVVRGNIDDFRVITDTGACLNYLIVKRSITRKLQDESTITNEYYYGFFITGVEQVGGSSVKVSVEPDDFTNVFYLHNSHQITAEEAESLSYEPFNERMKNCYINRQHYDRVANTLDHYELTINLNGLDADWDLDIGDWIQLYLYDGDSNPTIYGQIISLTSRGEWDITIVIKTSQKWDFGACEGQGDSEVRKETGGGEYSDWWRIYEYDNYSWQTVYNYVPTNQKIFLNQEDSFKFKYQYRDDRRPFSFSDVFTKE